MRNDNAIELGLRRRSVLKGAAWSVPVVAATTMAAPAALASTGGVFTIAASTECLISQIQNRLTATNTNLEWPNPAFPQGTQFTFSITSEDSSIVLPEIGLAAGYSPELVTSTTIDAYTEVFTLTSDYGLSASIHFLADLPTDWDAAQPNWALHLTVALPAGSTFGAGSSPSATIIKDGSQCREE
ncbi:hypothetical protein [Serinibacter salmoneus]|uniref:Uncharacterized protein n=1 Tax=Serinibacter salmoneus TaxID=556530 RepID=A0A2A9D080_9MICO|nr:hypothetical protein [Serinibacter salmoneus]PFG19249.1 hypothetical protein ATL40_0807 [Serinibacter salmoneus]